jgi:predicted protein tyrosine phosphatase
MEAEDCEYRIGFEERRGSLPLDPLDAAHPRKLLFVCARNKIRSLTAEKLLAHSPFYSVRSRGVAREARIKLTREDIGWADAIFVMEKNHKNRITKEFREAISGKPIVCLFIEDIYEPMEDALVEELRNKLHPHGIVIE